jgi:hypothetical protein
MANNLLRIGILILVGLVVFQVLKQSGFIGSTMEYAGEEEGAPQGPSMGSSSVAGDGPSYDASAGVRPHMEDKSQLYDYNYQVLPYPQIATSPTDSYFMAGGVCQPSDPGCYSGSVLQAPDLLPHDIGANAWNETSPQSQGHITDQNFLESGHHHGINTVGQSLKNANRQLRSDPPIAKVNISPWLNSTTDPDTNRKGFEIET